jgi:capsule polysaccharide export protein KpsC/LpsZ
LGLADDKPVVLLCTNVVGDSLALDRQVFTHGMADWLAETVRGLASRPEVQLVVRVHPGEMLGAGHSSIEIVRQVSPELPPGVVVIPPDSEINTYDLIGLAHLGLVYTSTVGLEMAMFGLPVVVCGDTHYRGKGFTYDPASMPEYLAQVGSLLQDPLGRSLPPEQVELAWRYAYLFFFEYPFPFPWHLLSFWEDLAARPLEQVVGEGGRGPYAKTLRALAGEPIQWAASRDSRDQEEPQLSPLAAATEAQR